MVGERFGIRFSEIVDPQKRIECKKRLTPFLTLCQMKLENSLFIDLKLYFLAWFLPFLCQGGRDATKGYRF